MATATTAVTTPAISIADASVVEGNVGTTSLVFGVTLAAPSAQTITVNYATTNGSATAGSDYVSTNGILTFPPGTTNQSLTVTVMGDITIEPDETLYVNLSNPVNGTLDRSQGVGTIINDDGLPGQVDHFGWSSVSSPQSVSQPFAVMITALDYYNNVATNFSGAVNLLAVSGSLGVQPGSIVPYFSDNNPTAIGPAGPITQAGFTPLQVTDISVLNLNNYRVLFIDEVDNYALSSSLLASLANIQAWVMNGGYLIIHDRSAGNISPNPFLLGTTGITTVRFPTADLDVIPPGNNLVVAGPFGTINNNTLDGGSSSAHGYVAQNQLPPLACPILSIGGNSAEVVDFSYPLGLGQIYYSSIPLDCYLESGDCSGNVIAAALQQIYTPNVLTYVASLSGGEVIPITPTNTGSFSNGVWSGNIIVLQPATNVVLRADDGNGHFGSSNPFDVLPDVLTITPADGLVSSGYQGGPFNPSNKVYTLHNNGTSSLDWSVSGLPTWVPVLTNASADAVRVIAINSPQGCRFFRARSLTAGVPPVLSAPAYAAGQFQFTLTGQTNATYVIETLTDLQAQSWMTVEPSGGSLAPGASTNATVLINTNACNLSNGVYAATAAFRNLMSGATQQRPVYFDRPGARANHCYATRQPDGHRGVQRDFECHRPRSAAVELPLEFQRNQLGLGRRMRHRS